MTGSAAIKINNSGRKAGVFVSAQMQPHKADSFEFGAGTRETHQVLTRFQRNFSVLFSFLPVFEVKTRNV
ncbi:MAG: hypothetical protein HWD62_05860 [Cyclobacteriaceae bacterium]|nr:MAG: hypothetical protein HWD62_05860 [Cyclobacteriaceae bacterium]